MIENENQYNTVKEILVEYALKHRKDRNTFKLEEWYEIISEKAHDKAYIEFSYEEFYEVFKKELVNGNFSDRKFIIIEEGFLDVNNKYPYAKGHIEWIKK